MKSVLQFLSPLKLSCGAWPVSGAVSLVSQVYLVRAYDGLHSQMVVYDFFVNLAPKSVAAAHEGRHR